MGFSWATGVADRIDRMSFSARAALFGSLVGAVVHIVLVPTHWGDERTTAILFIVDTVGFAAAFVWAYADWAHWRSIATAMLCGTASVYAWYILTGRETADLVGLITTTIELATGLVVLASIGAAVGAGARPRSSAERWTAVVAVAVALFSLLGTNAIANASSSSSPSSPTPAPTKSAPGHGTTASGSGMAGMGGGAPSSTAVSLATTSPAGSIVWPVDMPTTMASGMEMATPNCNATPTAAQRSAAVNLVNQTVSAAAQYKSLAAATAAGYIPVTRSGQRIVHYINPSVYREGATLDPSRIPVLVYVNTNHGAVLSAAMYLMPQSKAGTKPPQPGGCLTQWHLHTDLCFSGGRVVGNDSSSACAAGSFNKTSQPMMHVWLTPVAGGPLSPDPSGVNEVMAAAHMPVLSTPNGTA